MSRSTRDRDLAPSRTQWGTSTRSSIGEVAPYSMKPNVKVAFVRDGLDNLPSTGRREAAHFDIMVNRLFRATQPPYAPEPPSPYRERHWPRPQ